MCNLTSFCLEIVYCRCKIGALFMLDVPSAHISFWTHPMVTLAYNAQVEAYFGLFGARANLDAR